jgi:hypothetical protein
MAILHHQAQVTIPTPRVLVSILTNASHILKYFIHPPILNVLLVPDF